MIRFATTATLCTVLLIGASIALNQLPVAEIVVEHVSPQELTDRGWETHRSSGLSVVGVGELTYLSGHDAEGGEITAFAWFLEGPDGSTAVLDSTDGEWTTFRPDVSGRFTVTLEITTAAGVASTSLDITAAEWVGVGSMAGARPDRTEGQCAACHEGNAAEYFGTRHSSKLARDLDAMTFYAESCLPCHTTGYNKDAEAVNGGFDDLAVELGWTLPDTLGIPGNWDKLVEEFPALAQVSNIQCENCHGPGGQHYGDRRAIDFSLEEGVCGQCHDALTHHPKGTQWRASSMPSSIEELRSGRTDGGHSRGVASAARRATGNFAAADGFGCNGCHSGYGFVNRFDPASDLRDENLEPLITGNPQITCATCHDPHSDENHHQLRTVADVTLRDGTVVTFGDEGKFCMNCHKARENAEEYVAVEGRSVFRGPHHGPQSDMMAGVNAITFGRTLPNSTHKDVLEDACVSCHMYDTPEEGEPGHNLLGGHSWNMSVAQIVEGDTVEINNVAVCRNCHEPDMETFADRKPRKDYDGDGQIEGAQEEVHGLLEQLAMALPPIGEPEIAYNSDFTLLQRKALYNYLFVEEDQSFGIHNFQFTVNLLMLSRDVLSYGLLSEGELIDIVDVPNDEGKQVEVGWTRFGGDGPSDDPVNVYYVWRRSEMTSSKEQPTYASLNEVPADPSKFEAGATVSIDGEMWTTVATQPAAQLDFYTAIAPTLYDSTAEHGVKWSYFMVSGHTAVSFQSAVTGVDSVYSIDNLAPRVPSNVTMRVGRSWVSLDWDDPTEEDFAYFEVYRSVDPAFDPSKSASRVRVLSSEFSDEEISVGTVYFYRIAAYDFAGNRSALTQTSSPAVVTGVETGDETPTVFALHPNYPNPFNPSTTISYDVPIASRVRIIMYDVVGRPVQILEDGEAAPGRYSIRVDARDLSSGMYLVRMETPERVFEHSMVLLR